MKIEITRGKVPTAVKAVIFGTEGIGKSTLAAQFPNPLFIDTEGSTKFLTVGRLPAPKTWAELINEVRWAAAHPDQLDTLVVDTVDWAESMAIAKVCEDKGLKDIEAAGYGKGYTYLADEFRRFLRHLDTVIESGTNVVLVAHAAMRKQELPDERGAFDRWELKLQKKVAPLVKEWADLLLFCNYKTSVVTDANTKSKKATGGKRVMYTTHNPCWDAKNRFDLPDELDMTFLSIQSVFENAGKPVKKATEPEPKSLAQEWNETQEKAAEQLSLSKEEPKPQQSTKKSKWELLEDDDDDAELPF